jgi:hypothetical protein
MRYLIFKNRLIAILAFFLVLLVLLALDSVFMTSEDSWIERPLAPKHEWAEGVFKLNTEYCKLHYCGEAK